MLYTLCVCSLCHYFLLTNHINITSFLVYVQAVHIITMPKSAIRTFDYCRRLGGAFSKVVDRLCARHMGVIMLGIQGVIQRWIGVRPHIMGIPPINNTSLYLDDPTATPHPHPITHPTPQPTPPHPTRSRHVATIWQLGTELWPNGLSQEYPQTCLRRVNIENV